MSVRLSVVSVDWSRQGDSQQCLLEVTEYPGIGRRWEQVLPSLEENEIVILSEHIFPANSPRLSGLLSDEIALENTQETTFGRWFAERLCQARYQHEVLVNCRNFDPHSQLRASDLKTLQRERETSSCSSCGDDDEECHARSIIRLWICWHPERLLTRANLTIDSVGQRDIRESRDSQPNHPKGSHARAPLRKPISADESRGRTLLAALVNFRVKGELPALQVLCVSSHLPIDLSKPDVSPTEQRKAAHRKLSKFLERRFLQFFQEPVSERSHRILITVAESLDPVSVSRFQSDGFPRVVAMASELNRSESDCVIQMGHQELEASCSSTDREEVRLDDLAQIIRVLPGSREVAQAYNLPNWLEHDPQKDLKIRQEFLCDVLDLLLPPESAEDLWPGESSKLNVGVIVVGDDEGEDRDYLDVSKSTSENVNQGPLTVIGHNRWKIQM